MKVHPLSAKWLGTKFHELTHTRFLPNILLKYLILYTNTHFFHWLLEALLFLARFTHSPTPSWILVDFFLFKKSLIIKCVSATFPDAVTDFSMWHVFFLLLVYYQRFAVFLMSAGWAKSQQCLAVCATGKQYQTLWIFILHFILI